MYGTQTGLLSMDTRTSFENDVKMYGTQTWVKKIRSEGLFENDVKMYGTQTEGNEKTIQECLRMM